MAGARAEEDKAASDTVDSVLFQFYKPDEVKKMSVKKITKHEILDLKGSPVPDGVCDPALGPINDTDSCKMCGQLSVKCPGHCGHIELAKPLFNPLLFYTVKNILQITCFHCHKFKCNREKIKRFTRQLDLISKGDITGARSLEAETETESFEEGEGESESNFAEESSQNSEITKRSSSWTSIQYAEAHSVLNKLLGEKNQKGKCDNCGKKSPKITCPTFGWFNKELKGSDVRSNIISGYNVVEKYSESGPQSEVYDNSEGNGEDEIERKIGGVPEEEIKKMMTAGIQHLLPSEVEIILKDLWEKEAKICTLICDIQQNNLSFDTKGKEYEMFFLRVLLVPPNKFRPAADSHANQNGVLEHPHNALLSKVIQTNNNLQELSRKKEQDSTAILNYWMSLQRRVCVLYDSSKGVVRMDKEASGFRQILEKKSGILRQKMMGKRVNFACRSVISPDPYLAVNEIGIPPYFAMKLTYAERVTPWNLKTMRSAVLNGADTHPGATHFKDKDGMYKLQTNRSKRVSVSKKLFSSSGTVLKQGNGVPEAGYESKVVMRHMRDGDIVLVNRQPTLHKPSMMAHVVRVLKGEKTIRMHYANCSTYNADFDGDEMNVHFPQDEIARAEAINIVSANKQYNVPTSGDPIRGLIQDHIASAVLLTKLDTFLSREEYHQLLYGSVLPCYSSSSSQLGSKISILDSNNEIQPLPPAILKPKPLWTGKQVISAILNHITRGRPPFTVERKGRIPKEYLEDLNRNKKGKKGSKKNNNSEPDELTLYIHDNELVKGMIDKAQFGKFGIVHAVHELYGADSAGDLLSIFSRLFTLYLQMHGFTCGVDDLLIDPDTDRKRKKILEKSEEKSEDVHARFTGMKDATTDPFEMQKEVEKVIRRNGESATVGLDRMMCNALNVLTSEVNQTLFPSGLQKPFPKNCLSLMTTTGAKGSLVNMTQISSLLGQQELEGKRVPRMVSGKTLPCFPAWDTSSRSGGFISDRFLTGLRPQEYYFHCMAGRDGLVDTAIKTSRSGYLQRCLIKSLESLKVSYDYTVRDMDGSVIQFTYGEDGVDVQKSSSLSEFRLLADNKKAILSRLGGSSKKSSLSKSNKYIKDLPAKLENEASDFVYSPKSKQKCRKEIKEKDLMKLLKVKYLASLAEPGEPVGIVAAQSIGEPSTQMTLNTFHLAGRGDMNVTLGIPRLQEILMTASKDIRTPIMKCPLLSHTSREDAERVAAKLRRICVADVVERMDVFTIPFSTKLGEVSTIYKLKMRLFPRESFPPHSDLTLKECFETISTVFTDTMEDAIQKHIDMLNRIRDVKVVERREKQVEDDENDDGDDEASVKKGGEEKDEESESEGEDQGADAERRKMREKDEVEYEDDDDDAGMSKKREDVEEGEGDEDENENLERSGVENFDEEREEDYAMGGMENEGGEEEVINEENEEREEEKDDKKKKKKKKKDEKMDKGKDKKKDAKEPSRRRRKKKNRQINTEYDGLDFEVHYKFQPDDPRILLAEIAQRTAKSIYIRRSQNIERCSVADPEKSDSLPTLQTSGINFEAFWELFDILDVNKITSNNVHSMLSTYGVEAARATILKEVSAVFDAYGIGVNRRHLSLIADFMTFDGGYRPMNRFGVGEYSTSPFGKMTFETATKFIVQSAFHGEVDVLESPSASVCLGQPVKMGTGSFDLMQRIDC
ncbi:hypothetical protein LUZ60_017114 [Juncus effusus]|nr:hypothetical protein LUZ60_017114 [Juncus effusus]